MLGAYTLAILFIAGCCWCIKAFIKLPDDIESARNPKNPGERWVIIFYWMLTAVILSVAFCFGCYLLSNLSMVL